MWAPRYPPITAGMATKVSSNKSICPINVYVRKPLREDRRTAIGVILATLFGSIPIIVRMGEIIAPPPIPNNPAKKPDREPIKRSGILPGIL